MIIFIFNVDDVCQEIFTNGLGLTHTGNFGFIINTITKETLNLNLSRTYEKLKTDFYHMLPADIGQYLNNQLKLDVMWFHLNEITETTGLVQNVRVFFNFNKEDVYSSLNFISKYTNKNPQKFVFCDLNIEIS